MKLPFVSARRGEVAAIVRSIGTEKTREPWPMTLRGMLRTDALPIYIAGVMGAAAGVAASAGTKLSTRPFRGFGAVCCRSTRAEKSRKMARHPRSRSQGQHKLRESLLDQIWYTAGLRALCEPTRVEGSEGNQLNRTKATQAARAVPGPNMVYCRSTQAVRASGSASGLS